jgi:hypothetical protein
VLPRGSVVNRVSDKWLGYSALQDTTDDRREPKRLATNKTLHGGVDAGELHKLAWAINTQTVIPPVR